jgi:ABC-type Fe3+-hydroxamate transport system substrate-binding protein
LSRPAGPAAAGRGGLLQPDPQGTQPGHGTPAGDGDTAGPAVDWAGVAHPPAGPAPRLASLVPSLTELLFALGLGAAVVARTGFCVHPRDAVRRVPKIGGTKDPDLDALRTLAPTHLVVNVDENRRDVVEAARAFVPRVIVTHPVRPEDNVRLYALFGAIFGREREAAALAAGFAAALAELDAAVAALPRERVLYLVWKKPWMTVARDTYIAATLARAGWDTVPAIAVRRYPELAAADPSWRDADRILLSSEPYAFRPRDVDELAARHAKPVALVDGEMTSWYGPRAIAGMRYLGQLRRSDGTGR